MTLKKDSNIKQHASSKACSPKHPPVKRGVRFSVKLSPELVGDEYLQSSNTRRRYMRRGSRSPNMIAIHAVRSSAEVAKLEAFDKHQEKLEQLSEATYRNSLRQVIRRSFSLPKKTTRTQEASSSFDATKDVVENELARSLFQKTNLTVAQKRRLSLEIISRVTEETASPL